MNWCDIFSLALSHTQFFRSLGFQFPQSVLFRGECLKNLKDNIGMDKGKSDGMEVSQINYPEPCSLPSLSTETLGQLCQRWPRSRASRERNRGSRIQLFVSSHSCSRFFFLCQTSPSLAEHLRWPGKIYYYPNESLINQFVCLLAWFDIGWVRKGKFAHFLNVWIDCQFGFGNHRHHHHYSIDLRMATFDQKEEETNKSMESSRREGIDEIDSKLIDKLLHLTLQVARIWIVQH